MTEFSSRGKGGIEVSKNIGDENHRGDTFKSFMKLRKFKATGFRGERIQ